MLLEFKAKNYKSFKEELVFSLVPAPKQKDLEYSVLKETFGKKNKKVQGLCSAVIYGPNAAGKTSVIGAMDTFKSIVLRGNIRNADSEDPNVAAYALQLIPNNTLTAPIPTEFSIKFTSENLLIEYSFSVDLGLFLDAKHARKITGEMLKINERIVFKRESSLEFGDLSKFSSYVVNGFEQNSQVAMTLLKSNLDDEELFLMNGFKAMMSSKIVTIISNWINDKFMIVYRADVVTVIKKIANPEKKIVYIEKTVNEVATHFGSNSNAIGYAQDGDNNETKLFSLFDDGNAIPAEIFESYGTIRFVNMFPLIANVLVKGGVLIVDEFDASIHPMALMNLINIFHNDTINVNHAQLVFNTHNPIFLNGNLYRRDEIKFVERDEETHCSNHYSLSDFGTSGKGGVRKNEEYMKNYFINRYGAIKDVDFTSVIEKLIKNIDKE